MPPGAVGAAGAVRAAGAAGGVRAAGAPCTARSGATTAIVARARPHLLVVKVVEELEQRQVRVPAAQRDEVRGVKGRQLQCQLGRSEARALASESKREVGGSGYVACGRRNTCPRGLGR